MTQTLVTPLVFQIKRFWNSLNPPSPFGWICVLTLSLGAGQLTKNLMIRWALTAFYIVAFGLLKHAVTDLKKQAVDQRPRLNLGFGMVCAEES